MSDYVIECHNLETAYAASLNRPILNGINCQIKRGEFVVLLGLNGAGKSTLLRSLVGLVQPVKGEIQINGVHSNSFNILPKFAVTLACYFRVAD